MYYNIKGYLFLKRTNFQQSSLCFLPMQTVTKTQFDYEISLITKGLSEYQGCKIPSDVHSGSGILQIYIYENSNNK